MIDLKDAFEYFDVDKLKKVTHEDAKAIIQGMTFNNFSRRDLDDRVASLVEDDMVNFT